MAHKIAFINGKGGCGKTTSIFHVVGEISRRKQTVLVIDLDKQRNLSDILLMTRPEAESKIPNNENTIFDFMNGSVPCEDVVKKVYFKTRANAQAKHFGVDLLDSDVELENQLKIMNVDIKDKLETFIDKNKYDWVLVDMPPSNKKVNDICFKQIVDNVIVPFSSDIFSINGYGDIMDTINTVRKEIIENGETLNILGVYLARYMENCSVDKYIRNELFSMFGGTFIDIQIPLRADLRESIMFGRPISYYKNISKSRTAFSKLVDFIETKINDNDFI